MPGAPPPSERTPLLSASSERASIVETAPGSLGNGYGTPAANGGASGSRSGSGDASEASSASGQRTPRASERVPASLGNGSVGGGEEGPRYGSVMVGSPSNADHVTEQ